MRGKNIHVMPADDCWAVWTEGRLGRDTFDPREAAIAAGTERAMQNQVELFIHGRDGQIRERNSFGNDLRDTKGYG